LNRALFLPFVKLLQEKCEVIELAARTDYRLEKLEGMKIWHMPVDGAAKAAIEDAWKKLAGSEGAPCELDFRGRSIHVPCAANGAARFDFADLCQQPLGAADFVRVAHAFHTLVIENIPIMGDEWQNEAKRFILLIDALYDNAVKLVASASAEPDDLFQGRYGDEAFEFKRTASRLIEMRSKSYLALAHGAGSAKPVR
jgi:cell division protein ZapE